MKSCTAVKSTLVSLTTAAFVAVSGSTLAAGKLNVSNWAEYMAEDTIENFEKEYGIEVVFTPYDSAEAIDSKLLAGSSGYDVVSHSSQMVARLLQGNILQKIDRTKLPNMKHMSPDVMAQLGQNWDPGHNYIVPYMWGSHGVTYNKELVLETYPDAPIGSVDMIFDPKHMKELAKCGVAFLDSPLDIIPMALGHMGLKPDSTNRADYAKVEEMLLKVRPYIKTFDNYAYQRMPQKEFCVAVTWGPDGLLAMSGAEDADTGVKLDFFLPAKPQLWIDGWVIPKDAKNIENAHLFLDYMMRPEVGAADSNFTWYATANKTAVDQGMVDEAVITSPAAFPTPADISTMYTMTPVKPKLERLRTRTWTNFKAGN
ncbi:MAG: extracellular solute-binding protein [Gammaproteobacteria bacterium]|nr:extracellular solute-binding protein [Gammaproteobacteria bacterium]